MRLRTSALPVFMKTAIAAVAGSLLIGVFAAPAPAMELDLAGSGEAREPYQIATEADLAAVADAVNSDPGRYASSHYRLVADLDLDGELFPGLDTFSGVIDGAGHAISDIAYGRMDGRESLGFIHHLDGGTVRNVTFDSPRADNDGRSGSVAGIAVIAVEATIEGNSVVDAEFVARSAEKVGGLVAELDGGVVTDNWVSGTFIADEMPAGIAAYAKNASTVSRNLVSGDFEVVSAGGPDGTRGNDAGLIVGYPGTPNSGVYSHNVALSGSITYDGLVDGFVGRIIGFTGYDGWLAEENLANDEITIGGETVTGPGTKDQHGGDVSPDQLAQRTTYEELGWDLVTAWRWDDELGHPVPNISYHLFGEGTAESPFEIADESDLEFLAGQLNAGDARYAGDRIYALTADLDFTDREPFAGIDRFEGELNGGGHTITGLRYAAAASGDEPNRLGLIRELTSGAVRDLRLVDVRADGGENPDWVGGVAVVMTDSIVEGVSVIGAELVATRAEKVAGVAAEIRGSSIVRDSWVDGTFSADKMPAGITSYVADATRITTNLISADLVTRQTGGERGVNAGLVVAYPGAANDAVIDANVAMSGSIDYSGAIPGFAGRILGYVDDGEHEVASLRDNLAFSGIVVGGSAVSGSDTDQNGADRDADELTRRATYESIGWDFSETWTLDTELDHPVPRFVDSDERPNRVSVSFHGDSSTQRGFSWYSSSEGEQTVRISTDRAFSEAATADVAAETRPAGSGESVHQAVATDLQPGTAYYYRLGSPSAGVWSSVGSFVTSGEGDFSFVALTDTEPRNLGEVELSAETIAKSLTHVPDAEFMLHGGDIVERGDRERDWRNLLDASRSSLMSTTIAPTAGDREATDGAFVDHFTVEAPNGQDTTSGAYYSFSYGRAHVAVLNTNENDSQAISDEQAEWLRDDVLAARERGAEWIILSLHKGPYTSAEHLDDPDVMGLRAVLVPLIDELEIDLVLQGHDHVMSRTKVLTSDPDAAEGSRAVETTVIEEMRNGKRAEYAIDPDGTIYFLPNTAGAKKGEQATSAENGIDLEAYLQLFDRTGGQDTENFAGITVTEDRLTVDVYDIRNQSSPRIFDSFGIDRRVGAVDDLIAALPGADDLDVDDVEAVDAVRAEVSGLTGAQRTALVNLSSLEEREQHLRELLGLVTTDGSQIAWVDDQAEHRIPVTIRNDTPTTFTDTPVRVVMESTPEAAADTVAFFSTQGLPLAHEVETWEPGGTSVVWVSLPELVGDASTTVWAYTGGESVENDPTRVWRDDYALVEHLATDSEVGDVRVDSTGRQRGTVVGGDLRTTGTRQGTVGGAFGETRIEYPGDVGGDHNVFSISSIYTLTTPQYFLLADDAPIVAKESRTGDGRTTFFQGVERDSRQLSNRWAGNSFEFDDVDLNPGQDLPRLGSAHLVTQTYDGMTYSVFIDGREVHSEMVEYRTTYSDPAVLTTIGDFHTNTGELESPFPGTIDEVQIAGVAFTPDFEEFRYNAYVGDAVSVGLAEERSAQDVQLLVGTPAVDAEVEAGLIDFSGTLSVRADVTASVGGEEVWSGEVDAGAFTVSVPVNELGRQTVRFTAHSADGASTSAEVPLVVVDTRAPQPPAVTDDGADASAAEPEVTLTATPRTDDLERVDAEFFADELTVLDESNVQMREGSTADRTPHALTPDSGAVSETLLGDTVGRNENPFQIYEVSLTAEQALEDSFHLVWNGTGDDRTVSAWVWDHEASSWLLKDSDADADSGPLQLDVTALTSENAVREGSLTMLIWRGMTIEPDHADRDYTGMPDVADYDWAFDHVPDTQLYAQATPDFMVDMFRYIAETADERKKLLAIQAGDLVNRPYFSEEYQWRNAERAIAEWESAALPYMITWGNHDYHSVQAGRNNRMLMPTYYPMSRLEESLEGSPFDFGGSFDIDNYYYTAEIEGAKILLLTVGFWQADEDGQPGIPWARSVIEDHSDHAVILATHNVVGHGVNEWSNERVLDQLVRPYSNVKLILGGHIAGTGVGAVDVADGGRAYGVLTDYQSRVYGGQQYFKSISVDAENGLMYVNTYSPMLDSTSSDGIWHYEVAPGEVPGLHGEDSENFVLEIDLEGTTTRTIGTDSLTLAAGEPTTVGTTVATVGVEPVSVVMESVRAETPYEWYVELTDDAGHTTRSSVSTFTIGHAPARRDAVWKR